MDEDRPEDTSPPPDSGRAKRSPPTIDLEASEVSGQTQGAGAQPRRSFWSPFSRPFPWLFPWPFARPSTAAMTAMLTAGITGAVTAALVIAAAWVAGWPGETAPPLATTQGNAAAIDTLASRLDDIEARSVKPAAAAFDPALASRLEALEKSLASLRTEIAGARAQSEKLAADLNAVKSAPRQAASPDLAAINERLSQIERAARAENAEIAKADNKPADDTVLRRVVAASMLDVSVRQGEPFVAQLAAAKSLAPDPEALKPLDRFAAAGVPNPAGLSRELLTLVPKLSPPAQENATTGTGIVDRLQAGAAKLVRIQRTDVAGNDRGAVIARVTAAALRNDYTDARRELNTLAPGDRTAAQAWLDKANERDAALAASRHFATEAMAALAKPAQ
ncbi:COG4223 family protein [Bradyrhizobium sp.]|uniref:COG4223 family protein n=1 Tax=Bradyrhizobium sp. TaxID=376 RepID=UPI003C7111AD